MVDLNWAVKVLEEKGMKWGDFDNGLNGLSPCVCVCVLGDLLLVSISGQFLEQRQIHSDISVLGFEAIQLSQAAKVTES